MKNKMEDSRSNLSEKDVKFIVKSTNDNFNKIIDYHFINMNDQMLGFMADYYRLKVSVQMESGVQTLNYFIKAIPTTNEAKAEMVLSMNLFDQELNFYTIIKGELRHPAIRPWSPKLIASLKEAIVFEDMDVRNFKVRNKFHTFDEQHTFQALQSLARFHASSLIYEEKKRTEHGTWCMINEFGQYFDRGGYIITHPWYVQCMAGTLGVIKKHSKYKNNIDTLKIIESRWTEVWESNLELGEPSSVYRNVVAHSDLWNNNIMFHYSDNDRKVPDDCVFVDFQAVRCQPPAADLMLLLHCNLDTEYRETNMGMFLNYYYQELRNIFNGQGICLDNVMSYRTFLETTVKYRQWGLFLCACLMPTIWINDKLIAEIFCDTAKYKDILTKNKCSFINKMVEANDSYRNKLLPIYEEIIERYFLTPTKGELL